MASHALQIGLLVESLAQLNILRGLVSESGHQVCCSLVATEFESLRDGFDQLPVDAWLVAVAFESAEFTKIEPWLEQLQLPVMIDDGSDSSPAAEGYAAWRRRVLKKLQQLKGSINLQQHPAGAADVIWVLAASTGGPEAVRAFFQALPSGLDVGFVYVQHIDAIYEKSLADIVNRHSHYPAYQVSNGDVIKAQCTAIVANDYWVEFLANGTMAVKSQGWPGPYSPSIDQVFANVARSYGARAGVIVFSGMGDDGTAGARLIHQQGGQVWAQSPDSCTVASMPESVIASDIVTTVATPAQLAKRLTEFMQYREQRV